MPIERVDTPPPATSDTASGVWEFDQNNSGGYFIGPCRIYVEASSAEEANRIAAGHGVDENAPYCPCCGERWRLADGNPDFPSIEAIEVYAWEKGKGYAMVPLDEAVRRDMDLCYDMSHGVLIVRRDGSTTLYHRAKV